MLPSPLQATGLLLVLDHIFALALALALSALAVALGQATLRRGSLDLPRGLEGFVIALPLGSGLLALAIFVLAVSGTLHPLSLAAVLFSLGWLAGIPFSAVLPSPR